jgi:hypothetical protein
VFRRRSSALTVDDAQGYDAASYQELGVDGYVSEPVVATFQQVGKYKLPLASVFNQNNGGLLRKDGVGDLDSRPNVYMPQWSAPSNGASVNQVGGMVQNPMASYLSNGVPQANSFTANADQAAAVAQFMNSRSPRYAGFSALSGD